MRNNFAHKTTLYKKEELERYKNRLEKFVEKEQKPKKGIISQDDL